MNSFSGKILSSRYRIDSIIGAGGVGIVYKGFDLITKETLAIKVLKQGDYFNRVENIIRLKREAAAVSRLDNPGIIRVFEVGAWDHVHYLVTEYVDGQSLDQFFEHHKKIPLDQVLTIISGISETLAYVHDHEIIHRDIKPGNVILTGMKTNPGQTLIPKIGDFGLSRFLNLPRKHDQFEMSGTYCYMSPEQAGLIRHPVDSRTDLYSVGIIFYKLLTGRLAFQGRDVSELFHQMMTLTPEKPGKVNPEVPEIIETMVTRLIDKDPEKRYQTAEGLCHDLRLLQAHEPIEKLSCDDPARRIMYRTRHIGRERQLEILRSAFHNASRGSGSICLVSGEAGSGKTRLCDEFATWAMQQNALCLSAVCLSQENNQTPYQVFSDVIMQYVQHIELLPEGLRREWYGKIRSSAGELAGLLGKLSPILAEALGELPEVVLLDPEKEQKRFAAVCARVVCGFGDAARPMVIVLEDLQWTDPGSMDIFCDIWLHIASVPLMVVGNFREKEINAKHPLALCRAQAVNNDLPFCELPIEGFSQTDMEGLLTALFRTEAAWTNEIAAFVLRKSSGNPLYAMEILRQLVGKEVLAWREGQWRFDRGLLGKINIPDAMVDVVMSRIASIDGRLSGLLSLCALIGKRFSIDVVLSLPDIGSGDSVVALLDTAVELDLIEWDQYRTGNLFFIHDRIRDAFAERLSRQQKSALHGTIGTALEKRLSDAENETLFLLVHHFFHSGDWKRCLRYSLEAAQRARASHAIALAVHYYELSIRLSEENGSTENPEWKTAAEGLIELYPALGKIEDANTLANALFSRVKLPLEKARLHRIIASNYMRVSAFDRAGFHYGAGLALLGKKIPKSRLTTIILTAVQLVMYPLTTFLWPLRGNRERMEASERDREIALFYQSASMLFVVSDYIKYFWAILALMNHARRTMGASKELADAVMSYAMVYIGIPWVSRSLFHHDRALRMKVSIGDRAGVAESHMYLGFVHTINANWEKAIEHMSSARETYEAIGDFYQLVQVLNGLQNIHYLHTDTNKRLPVLKSLLSVGEMIGSRYGTAIALTGLGGHYLMTGELETSSTFLDRAIEMSTAAKQWIILCIGQTNRARLYLEQLDLDSALERVTIAAELERTYSLIHPVVAVRYIVMVEVLTARFASQEKSLTESERRKALDRLHMEVRKMVRATRKWPLWRGDAIRARAEFYLKCGETDKAKDDFRVAAEILVKTGKNNELARCYFHYGKLLIGQGKLVDASPLLQSALEIFRRIGARSNIDRTLSLLGAPNERHDDHSATDSSRLASLLEVSRTISSLQDLDALLKEILYKAVEVTGANRGHLFFVNDSKKCELRVSHNSPLNDTATFVFSRNIVEQVQNTGRTVLTMNAAHQESFNRFESVSANDMKSILCAPIIRRGTVLGVCYLDNSITSGVFDGGDRELLEAFMAQAAVCIENARAFDELRQHNRKLADDGDRMKKRNDELQRLVQFQSSHLMSFGDVRLVTQDSTMIGLIGHAKRFADSHAPVLITGDSGSGKEVFAHLIHFSGRRKEGPFVKVNCSTIPETLFESEFFGYEKGAFTGAAASRKGKFEIADGGTLMLDEIADLPLSQQSKLLRVLEDKEITPVGGSSPRKVDVRVVAATNRDIGLLISEEKFRQDLFFRLNVLNLVIPPLSKRPDDVPVLAAFFLSSIANAEGGREKRFDEAALLSLRKMAFEGNVRQLKNIVYRLYVACDKDVITGEDVRQCLPGGMPSGAGEETAAVTDARAAGSRSFFETTMPFSQAKERFEKKYFHVQLLKHESNLTRTAQALELLPSALSRKLKDLGIKLTKGQKKQNAEADNGAAGMEF
jgi:transcriptional regulator with GAF, ATPase, and Fis domain/serine/threonine protein kinase